MAGLRGFGFTIAIHGGGARTWYIDGEGAKRWADNDEIVRGLAGQHDVDLLGKEVNKQPKPWEPFYCFGCAGTRSVRCKKHGTRNCANSGCNVGGCESCHLEKEAQEQPR